MYTKRGQDLFGSLIKGMELSFLAGRHRAACFECPQEEGLPVSLLSALYHRPPSLFVHVPPYILPSLDACLPVVYNPGGGA